MPVPVTLQHRWRWAATTCTECGTSSDSCWYAEVVMQGKTETTKALCLTCMSKEDPEVLVFEATSYTSGVRAPTHTMKQTAQRRERRLAAAIGGRVQPGSGSGPHAKGDARKRGEWLGDDKTARNLTTKGYHLTLPFLQKVRSWCKKGEKFFITIGFLDPITRRPLEEVVVIDRHVWEEKFFHADDDR